MVRGKFRDKSRDELAKNLDQLGVKAKMLERKIVQEKIGNVWWMRTLGVIEINEGPIKWINILKKDRSQNSPPAWRYIYIIPDERISGSTKIKVKTHRKKSFPLFGKIIDTTWKGEDQGTELISLLSNDEVIKKLAKDLGNMEIESRSSETFRGWTLYIDRPHFFIEPSWLEFNSIPERLLKLPMTL
ncbi:MAG: hypothetical protein FI718_09445 [SAR202 cluster bacterium]|nr:hypothetical protein [SAR202 cluster bacterium]|tara:strand:- start:135 stop:695 length:561 start_codon:yes stop_codon:yes gene_type:complete